MSLRTIDAQELKNMLELHRKWVMGGSDGKIADLSYANLSSANLRSANLSSANLRSANLRSANLRYANLSYADLSSADLSSADLSYADLRSANLRSADLSYANLSSANLRSANLRSANLSYANLSSADLSSANLSSANLKEIKEDFLKVLAVSKDEAVGLYDSLIRGKVDGSQYEGECACLVGTVAKIRHEHFEKLSIDLRPDSSRPAEKWFIGISKGDTPSNNQVSKITVGWMEEFLNKNDVKIPQYRLFSDLEKPELFK